MFIDKSVNPVTNLRSEERSSSRVFTTPEPFRSSERAGWVFLLDL